MGNEGQTGERFSELSVHAWRQFERVALDLNPKLVVLTGPNGCGKTTLLNVLGRHFGWNVSLISTPHQPGKRSRRFWSDVWDVYSREHAIEEGDVKVGSITYSSGTVSSLLAPSKSEQGPYALKYANQRGVVGLHIPSHRPVSSHFAIETIPVNPKSSQQQYQEFQNLLFQTYGSTNARNPGLILKQSLIALAIFGEGSPSVQANLEYSELFSGFQDVLRKLLPSELGFERLEVRMPDIVLCTQTGTFSLDSMSGGVSAVFGMAWQIFMFGADKGQCTVIIDEPENHLHPSMQRQFLPALLRAFPLYQFIVATHSPFVVASSADAAVYALLFNDNHKIESHLLDDVDLSGSTNRILREVLDVPTTVPVWVEDRVREVLRRYEGQASNPETASAISRELKEAGVPVDVDARPLQRKDG